MVKFVVVLYRKAGMSREAFRRYLEEVHGPMAEALPRLARYVRNFPGEDPRRRPPTWDAVVEIWWESRDTMEAAWRSAEGETATADLEAFADLERSSWAIVDEIVVR